jgi:hypothetical protein
MIRGWTSALLGLLLVGCASTPSERLTWRETWNLVVADESGLLIDARLQRGNTGLLAGQGHLGVTVIPTKESVVTLDRTAPPVAVSVDAERGDLRLVHNRLVHDSDGWTLHIREGREALDATLHLAPSAPELAPATLVEGQRQWLLGVPVPHGVVNGAWRAGKQGDLIRGHGMLIRQSTDTWPGDQPARSAVYIIGPERSVGVELVGDQSLAWLVDEEGLRSGRTATVTRTGRKLLLDLRPDLPVTAKLRLGIRTVVREPWAHLLPFERLAARLLFGWPLRSYERARAELEVDGEKSVSAALARHGELPPTKERRRRDRADGE